MELKNLWYYYISFVLLLTQVPQAAAITTAELADIIEQMESAIVDISMEYECRVIPPPTHEELEKEGGFEALIAKDGYRRYKFSAAGLLSKEDPNVTDWNAPGQFLLEEWSTMVTKEQNEWDNTTKQAYNGQVGKSLTIGGWPPKEPRIASASVSYNKPYVYGNLTPLGFSVLRPAYFQGQTPLSDRLRARDKVRLDNVVKKIDGFNTIRADLLTDFLYEGNRLVYMRIYFSVDHGYTPVKFEHMKGPEMVAASVNVESLEEVAEGLWFPVSGTFTIPGSDRVSTYQAISPILVNQGFTDEHFDIDFPVGTKVYDEIQDRDYIVKQE